MFTVNTNKLNVPLVLYPWLQISYLGGLCGDVMYDGRNREDVKEKDTCEVRGELGSNEGPET